MHFGGARGSQDRPGYPRGRSCARPAPTPRQRPRPSGPSGKHPPHRGGGKSRLSYPEARSLELDGSRRGPFCRARALLQGVKRARCPCPGAGGRRRCRTHAGALLTAARRSTCRASLLRPPAEGRVVRRKHPTRRCCHRLPPRPPVLRACGGCQGACGSPGPAVIGGPPCCQRRLDQLALRKRSRSRISAGRASPAAAHRPLLPRP